jgi:hypothetical protein
MDSVLGPDIALLAAIVRSRMAQPFPVRQLGLISALVALTAAVGCGTDSGLKSGTPDPGDSTPDGPSQTVTAGDEVPAELAQALSVAKDMDADALTGAYPPPASEPLGYDATAAAGMDLIQASALALSSAELATLDDNGVVISTSQTFPSFAYGYKTIYSQDLPVYVSADSILEAVHRTFDSLLEQTETLVLIDELTRLLTGMRGKLAGAFTEAQLTQDADLYLTLAASLLAGQKLSPAASDNSAALSELYDLATAAAGHKTVKLFGVERDEDFSQFEPRGHYTDSEELGRYFKAMMWLGRVDMRIIETQSDGSQTFYRRQFDAAAALRELMGDSEMKLWSHVDATIGAYVGEHDSMTPKDMDGLLKALGVDSFSASKSLTDQEIIDEIAEGGWGAQRIASRIIINGSESTEPLPLDRSFLLFGQRYTVDSHTFVNVTYDRVADRLMPNPLDAAFAALGNDAALPLLSSEFANESYVHGLAKTRTLVDAHESAYWEGSLYTRWLGALRALSPDGETVPAGVPKTEGWQKRMLSTQLGSWAELRHDTILYVKQSYTTGESCEFPDAYVDPYPEFYAKLGAMAQAVAALAQDLPEPASQLRSTTASWAAHFQTVMNHLELMAEDQVSGTPHSQELLDFINDAVRWDEENMCGGVSYSNLAGWYLELYLNDYAGLEVDPTVADVHTQPTDAAGNDVGRILHVGTGMPRLMVVTAQTCQGARAYAGLAFAYGERITDNWERLNDQEWQEQTYSSFPDVPWMSSVLAE